MGRPLSTTKEQRDTIRFLYETTLLSVEKIAEEVGTGWKVVYKYVHKTFDKTFIEGRKFKVKSLCKSGVNNPNFGKVAEKHSRYKGVISDGKGYQLILKPKWYTGKPRSKHVFYHHVVVCIELGLSEVPAGFCVHHCDRDPTNNTPDNLVMLTRQEHVALHRYLGRATTISKESTLKWVEARRNGWLNPFMI